MEKAIQQSVGAFVANDHRTAAVFQKYGIDFCCRGGKSLADACEQRGISADTVLDELTKTMVDRRLAGSEFLNMPLNELTAHIKSKHHVYVEQAIPVLIQFLDKLCDRHGGNHPELHQIREEFTHSARELSMHMKKEELILFPLVDRMALVDQSDERAQVSIQEPIRVMMADHEQEGDRFARMRSLSNDYTPPEDACTTYRVTYSLLKEFEEDLHFHIHLENNILFPRALQRP